DAIEPSQTAAVRLRLPAALPLLPGDRFVLRESGREETIGGGEIVDVDPLRRGAWIEAAELEKRTGVPQSPTVGRWVVDDAAVDAMRADVRARVPFDIAALDERERAVLATLDDVVVANGVVRFAADEDPLAGHPWLRALEASPFSPPGPDGVAPAEVRELVRRNLVVERDGIYFAPAAVDAAASVVARLLAGAPDGVTVAQIRDALGTSRKYLLPLLAVLDGSGVTRRRGDLRIGGPRLPH
ncbi:MAG: selenocysteine-specific elongation factor, partial [Actinomycetota bacterium]|nr:selenocysteine-specific elongation factor [Actinomycetota bacterium]